MSTRIKYLLLSMILMIPYLYLFSQNKFEIDMPCSDCHTSQTWKVSTPRGFNHRETSFPLIGQHTAANCLSCHKGQTTVEIHTFKNVPKECISCHFDIHTNQYGTDCEQCHEPYSWNMDNWWDLHDETPFPLNGLHSNVSCESCHKSFSTDLYESLPNNCYGCHLTKFEEAHNSGENTDCILCHSSSGWVQLIFNHTGKNTVFPLTGIHRTVSCDKCHIDGQYKGTPKSCGADDRCHLDDFLSSSNEPDHTFFGYPDDYCKHCHNAFSWLPDIYTHSPMTSCETCHLPDYGSVTEPLHDESQGYTTECEMCHSNTQTWQEAFFDHSTISEVCISCHLLDYEATTNPNHQQLAYDTDCTVCHNTTDDWTDVTFDHVFPIGADVHQTSIPELCSSCHIVEQDYSQFTCMSTECHVKSDTDNQHSGIPQYQYDASTCYSCHPTGEKEMTSHDDLYFQIYKGKHRNEWNNCTECHVFGDFQTFSCTDVSGCHEHSDLKMDDEHCKNTLDCKTCNGLEYDLNDSSSDQCIFCHPTGSEDECEGGDGDDRRKKVMQKRNDPHKLPEFKKWE